MLLFVSGTDTGVGKTLVTALLALKFRQQGQSVAVCKPFASGCFWRNGKLESEDAVWLKTVLQLPQSLEEINPIALEEPLAPLVAARRAGISTLDWPSRAYAAIETLSATHDVVLVEGVGGWEVPLCESEHGIYTVRAFAMDLDCPVVIVARRTLGTLNHTLLTTRAAFNPQALIFNDSERIDENDVAARTNVALLREMTELDVWGEIPFLGDKRDDAATLESVAASLNCDGFFGE